MLTVRASRGHLPPASAVRIRGIVRAGMKRIAPSHQHVRKTSLAENRVFSHEIIAEKFGRECGEKGEFA